MNSRTTTTKGPNRGLSNEAGAAARLAWSYYGSTEYEGNFVEDLDAIGSEACLSTDCSTSTSSISDSHAVGARENTAVVETPAGSVYADANASVTGNQGSIYDLDSKRPPLIHDIHMRLLILESEATGPSPLETWMSTQERHDLLSYQGIQPPTRKRKVADGWSCVSQKDRSNC